MVKNLFIKNKQTITPSFSEMDVGDMRKLDDEFLLLLFKIRFPRGDGKGKTWMAKEINKMLQVQAVYNALETYKMTDDLRNIKNEILRGVSIILITYYFY